MTGAHINDVTACRSLAVENPAVSCHLRHLLVYNLLGTAQILTPLAGANVSEGFVGVIRGMRTHLSECESKTEFLIVLSVNSRNVCTAAEHLRDAVCQQQWCINKSSVSTAVVYQQEESSVFTDVCLQQYFIKGQYFNNSTVFIPVCRHQWCYWY